MTFSHLWCNRDPESRPPRSLRRRAPDRSCGYSTPARRAPCRELASSGSPARAKMIGPIQQPLTASINLCTCCSETRSSTGRCAAMMLCSSAGSWPSFIFPNPSFCADERTGTQRIGATTLATGTRASAQPQRARGAGAVAGRRAKRESAGGQTSRGLRHSRPASEWNQIEFRPPPDGPRRRLRRLRLVAGALAREGALNLADDLRNRSPPR